MRVSELLIRMFALDSRNLVPYFSSPIGYERATCITMTHIFRLLLFWLLLQVGNGSIYILKPKNFIICSTLLYIVPSIRFVVLGLAKYSALGSPLSYTIALVEAGSASA